MKIPGFKRLQTQDFNKKYHDLTDSLFGIVNPFMEVMTQALNKRLSYSDNFDCLDITLDVTAPVIGLKIKNSQGGSMRGAEVLSCVSKSTGSSNSATLTDQGVTYTSIIRDSSINTTTINLVNPMVFNSPLTISVFGSAILVLLGTNDAGFITTTSAGLVRALNANSSTSSLILASGSGTNTLIPLVTTPLSASNNSDITGAPFVQFIMSSDGQIQITNITGLTAGKSYTIRIIFQR